MSDPTEAEKAAKEAADEWFCGYVSSKAELHELLRAIILRHMQAVIDAARAEGCRPTQDDKAEGERLTRIVMGVSNDNIADALARARAEGRRELVGSEHPEWCSSVLQRAVKAESALERVLALWPHTCASGMIGETPLPCNRCKIEEAINRG